MFKYNEWMNVCVYTWKIEKKNKCVFVCAHSRVESMEENKTKLVTIVSTIEWAEENMNEWIKNKKAIDHPHTVHGPSSA